MFDHSLKLMCAAVIEAVLQHTVWCVQPESCHKQSALASVKQEAWENRVLGRLQPTPRTLNRQTLLPNALISKWALGITHDTAILMKQQVGNDLSDSSRGFCELLGFDTVWSLSQSCAMLWKLITSPQEIRLSGWNDFTHKCDGVDVMRSRNRLNDLSQDIFWLGTNLA